MKIIAAICVILVGFLGFQLFDLVTDEIDEAQLSSINEVHLEDLTERSVDNLMEKIAYTHRTSTYEHPSTDLIKASATLAFNEQYASVLYFKEDQLIHEEYAIHQFEKIDFGDIQTECALIVSIKDAFETNLKDKDYTFYDLGSGYKMIHIHPNQTGKYQLSTDTLSFKFQMLKK